MIKVEHIETYGWESAVRGARNPMNSWDKLDSTYVDNKFVLGDNDFDLLKRLSLAGNDHGKFMRMIGVSMDITAPLYWWKQADQYKVGTTTNSCSTMHKIHAKEFGLSDFSFTNTDSLGSANARGILLAYIDQLNWLRSMFLQTKDKKYWYSMIELLPNAYLQKRTWTGNYAVLKNMYHARKDHKIDEWKDLCAMIEGLPYSSLITG